MYINKYQFLHHGYLNSVLCRFYSHPPTSTNKEPSQERARKEINNILRGGGQGQWHGITVGWWRRWVKGGLYSEPFVPIHVHNK